MKKITTRPNGSIRIQTIPMGVTKTQKQFEQQCNINNIMKKYTMRSLPNPIGQYLDISDLPNYHEAMNTIVNASYAFSQLSADLRKRFNNDPQEMINFLNDPNNRSEAINIGLINKPIDIPQNTNEQNKPKQNKSKQNEPKQNEPKQEEFDPT